MVLGESGMTQYLIKNIVKARAGRDFRQNRNRYFYVRRCGWFVLTRGELVSCGGIEMHTGVAGPFEYLSHAEDYLTKLISQYHQENCG